MLRGLCGVSDTLEECPPTGLRKLPRRSTFPPAGREHGWAMQGPAPALLGRWVSASRALEVPVLRSSTSRRRYGVWGVFHGVSGVF